MLEALWSLEILTEAKILNAGIVFFQPRRVFGDFYEAGRILGGDRNYVYSGNYTIENHNLSAQLSVKQYAAEPNSIFGDEPEFELRVSGNLDRHVSRDVHNLTAKRTDDSGQLLSLRLTKRVELS